MVKSIYIYLVLLSLILFSCSFNYRCSGDPLFENLKENVSLKTIDGGIIYDSLRAGNYLIIKPKLSNLKFNEIINQNFAKSIKEKLCDTKGEVIITYTVKHYTLNFISIVKSTYIECQGMPSFSFYEDGLNLLIFNQNLYSVETQYSKRIEDEVTASLKKKVEAECFEDKKVNRYLDLFFQNGKAYITNPLHSKLCNETVEIGIKNENFKIIPVHFGK